MQSTKYPTFVVTANGIKERPEHRAFTVEEAREIAKIFMERYRRPRCTIMRPRLGSTIGQYEVAEEITR